MSIPSERLFSQAGILYEEHCNRIMQKLCYLLRETMPCYGYD